MRLNARLLPLLLPALGLLVLFVAAGELSVRGYELLAGWGEHLPHVAWIATGAIGALGVMVAVALLRLWRLRADPAHAARIPATMGAVVGVGVAVLATLGIKQLFREGRPCWSMPLAADCPAPGDWSFPSNHATVAFAGLAVLAVATRRAWVRLVGVLLAVTAAVGRVLEGVHYPHDVAAGAVVGLLVVGLCALVADRRLAERWRLRAAAPATPAGRG